MLLDIIEGVAQKSGNQNTFFHRMGKACRASELGRGCRPGVDTGRQLALEAPRKEKEKGYVEENMRDGHGFDTILAHCDKR